MPEPGFAEPPALRTDEPTTPAVGEVSTAASRWLCAFARAASAVVTFDASRMSLASVLCPVPELDRATEVPLVDDEPVDVPVVRAADPEADAPTPDALAARPSAATAAVNA